MIYWKARHSCGGFMASESNILILLQGLQLVKVASSSRLQATAVNYPFLQNLPEAFKTHFRQIYPGLLESRQLQYPFFFLESHYIRFPSIAVTSSLLAILICIIIFMTNWARSIWNGGRPRLSPFGSRLQPPKVSEDDYSYITSSEITPPGRTYGQSKNPSYAHGSETNEDVLVVENDGASYTLRFPANSINEGKLRIQDVKKHLATTLNLPRGSEHDIELQYKGQVLDDNFRACKDYDLRNESLIYYTADEITNRSDDSTVDPENADDIKRRRRRGKKGKKAASRRKDADCSHHANINTRSTTPAVKKIQSPLEKLDTLSCHFQTKLVPLCMEFINAPPEDEKKKNFEHGKITEAVMSDVLLKLDAVETDGDNDARKMRKDLVKEVQEILCRLDAAIGK